MITQPLELAFTPAAALPLAPMMACAMDRHLGPYEPLAELAGWLGAEWCRCRCCGSSVTQATTRRNAA